jgi:hypothetical protein
VSLVNRGGIFFEKDDGISPRFLLGLDFGQGKTTMAAMASLTLKLPATLNRRLRATARRRRENLSAFTRRALESELGKPENRSGPKPDFATLAKPYLGMFSGPGDLSAREGWDNEIRARVKAVDEGRVTGIPYEKIKKEMASRFGR